MSVEKRFICTSIIAVLVVLLLSMLSLSVVRADSNIPYQPAYSHPVHSQIPLFPGPDNTSQTNNGNSIPAKILIPIPILIPTPIPTPVSNDELAKFHIFFSVPHFSSFPPFVQPVLYNNRACGDGCLFNFSPSSIQNTEPISEMQITRQWELISSNPEITWFNPGFNVRTGSVGLVPPPVPTIRACGNCFGSAKNSSTFPSNLIQGDQSVQSTYQTPDDYYEALQVYQNNLTQIQKKIDTNILSLFLDPDYPKLANEDLSMQRAGTAIPASDLGPGGVLYGDAVHVYIDVKPGTSPDVINPYIYGSLSYGLNSFSATVPLKNIYALASLPQVLKITLAATPELAGIK